MLMAVGTASGAAYPKAMALSPGSPPNVRLRPATLADVATLERWDRQPHVIACSSDRPDLEVAFDGIDWREELADDASGITTFIAEADGRPVGVLQVCDPHTEPSHYWGEIEPGLRAIDIWIGEPNALNGGIGTAMMTQALNAAFADKTVDGVVIDPLTSNTAAHRFYQRLGFRPEGRRVFNDEDDCLVHRLTRGQWEAR